jgi:hypothetical protein
VAMMKKGNAKVNPKIFMLLVKKQNENDQRMCSMPEEKDDQNLVLLSSHLLKFILLIIKIIRTTIN